MCRLKLLRISQSLSIKRSTICTTKWTIADGFLWLYFYYFSLAKLILHKFIITRLIEGSESELQTGRVDRIVAEERKQIMQQRLRNLRNIVAHLIKHMVTQFRFAKDT